MIKNFFNFLFPNKPNDDMSCSNIESNEEEPKDVESLKRINLLKETNSENEHNVLFKIIKNPLNGIAFIENKHEIVYKRSNNKTGCDSLTVFAYNKTLDKKSNLNIKLNNIESNCSHELHFELVIDSHDHLLDLKIRSGELKKKSKINIYGSARQSIIIAKARPGFKIIMLEQDKYTNLKSSWGGSYNIVYSHANTDYHDETREVNKNASRSVKVNVADNGIEYTSDGVEGYNFKTNLVTNIDKIVLEYKGTNMFSKVQGEITYLEIREDIETKLYNSYQLYLKECMEACEYMHINYF